MTQQNTDEQPVQKYHRLTSKSFDSYLEARLAAEIQFSKLTGLGHDHEMTNETHKVRVKRRTHKNVESFDVVAYERIGLKVEEPKVEEVTVEPEKKKVKAKERRKKEQKK